MCNRIAIYNRGGGIFMALQWVLSINNHLTMQQKCKFMVPNLDHTIEVDFYLKLLGKNIFTVQQGKN